MQIGGGMERKIKKAAVLGAGVMGATIAAHLANVGIPSIMLDIVPNQLTPEEEKKGLTLKHPAVRSRFAINGKQNLLKMRPAALAVPEFAGLIEVGNFEDHLSRLAEVDWIIEVVVENLKIKQDLLKKVAAVRRPGTILSTNTSGIPVKDICAGMDLEIKQHFLGTHFFNPPRYMKLLEIIPLPETLPEVVEFMADFGERVLGKGIVYAKDSPNFIANRIGIFGMLNLMKIMAEEGLTIEEVDAITGPAMGRPKSASFGTTDLVGLDTFAHVAKNLYENAPQDEMREVFKVPDFVQKMLEKKWLGQQDGAGFLQKDQDRRPGKKSSCWITKPWSTALRKKSNFPPWMRPRRPRPRRIRPRPWSMARTGPGSSPGKSPVNPCSMPPGGFPRSPMIFTISTMP